MRSSASPEKGGEGLGAQSAMRLIDKSRFNIEKNIIQLLGRGQFRWKYPTDSGQHRIFVVFVLKCLFGAQKGAFKAKYQPLL